MVDLSQIPTGVEVATLGSLIFLCLRFLATRIPLNIEERALANIVSFLVILLVKRLRSKPINPHTHIILDTLHSDIITLREKLSKRKIVG